MFIFHLVDCLAQNFCLALASCSLFNSSSVKLVVLLVSLISSSASLVRARRFFRQMMNPDMKKHINTDRTRDIAKMTVTRCRSAPNEESQPEGILALNWSAFEVPEIGEEVGVTLDPMALSMPVLVG